MRILNQSGKVNAAIGLWLVVLVFGIAIEVRGFQQYNGGPVVGVILVTPVIPTSTPTGSPTQTSTPTGSPTPIVTSTPTPTATPTPQSAGFWVYKTAPVSVFGTGSGVTWTLPGGYYPSHLYYVVKLLTSGPVDFSSYVGCTENLEGIASGSTVYLVQNYSVTITSGQTIDAMQTGVSTISNFLFGSNFACNILNFDVSAFTASASQTILVTGVFSGRR